MVKLRGQTLVQQGVLQWAEILGAKIEILTTGAFFEEVGQAILIGQAKALDHRVAKDDGAWFGRVEATIDVAGTVTIGSVLDTEAAALVVEMAVGTVPNAKGWVDVGDEGVVVHVVGGLAGRPVCDVDVDEAEELNEKGEDEEVDGDDFERRGDRL